MGDYEDLCNESADALEAAYAEVEKLRGELDIKQQVLDAHLSARDERMKSILDENLKTQLAEARAEVERLREKLARWKDRYRIAGAEVERLRARCEVTETVRHADAVNADSMRRQAEAEVERLRRKLARTVDNHDEDGRALLRTTRERDHHRETLRGMKGDVRSWVWLREREPWLFEEVGDD